MEYDPFSIKSEPRVSTPLPENELTTSHNLDLEEDAIKTETLEIEDYGSIDEELFQDESSWKEISDRDDIVWMPPPSPNISEPTEDPLATTPVLRRLLSSRNKTPINHPLLEDPLASTSLLETFPQSKNKIPTIQVLEDPLRTTPVLDSLLLREDNVPPNHCHTEKDYLPKQNKTQIINHKVFLELGTVPSTTNNNNGPEVIFSNPNQAAPKLSNKELSIFSSSFVPCHFCLGFFPKSIFDNHLDSCKFKNSSCSVTPDLSKTERVKEALGSGGLFLPCKSCLGFFSKDLFDRHLIICKSPNSSGSHNSNLNDKILKNRTIPIPTQEPQVKSSECRNSYWNNKTTKERKISRDANHSCAESKASSNKNQNIQNPNLQSISANTYTCRENLSSSVENLTQMLPYGTKDLRVKSQRNTKLNLKSSESLNISEDIKSTPRKFKVSESSNLDVEKRSVQHISPVKGSCRKNARRSANARKTASDSNPQTNPQITKECYVKVYRDLDGKVYPHPGNLLGTMNFSTLKTNATIGNIAKSDPLICELRSQLSKEILTQPEEKYKTQEQEINCKLRELGMLVYKLRVDTGNPSFELKDFLSPEHLSAIVLTVKEFAGISKPYTKTKPFLPPIVDSLTSSLAKCAQILIDTAFSSKDSSLIETTECFTSIMSTKWPLNFQGKIFPSIQRNSCRAISIKESEDVLRNLDSITLNPASITINVSRKNEFSQSQKQAVKPVEEKFQVCTRVSNRKRKQISYKELDGGQSDDSSCNATFADNDSDFEYFSDDVPKKKPRNQSKSYLENTFSKKEESTHKPSAQNHTSQSTKESTPQTDKEDLMELENQYKSQGSKENYKLLGKRSSQHPLKISKKKQNKRPTKRNSCIYCKKLVSYISRHLKLSHSKEPEVEKILATPEGSNERKVIFEELRKKGNFYYNTSCIRNQISSSMILPRTIVDNKKPNHVPCKFCLGFYAKDILLHHVKRCKLRKSEDGFENCQEEGAALLASSCGILEEDSSLVKEDESTRESTLEEKNSLIIEEMDSGESEEESSCSASFANDDSDFEYDDVPKKKPRHQSKCYSENTLSNEEEIIHDASADEKDLLELENESEESEENDKLRRKRSLKSKLCFKVRRKEQKKRDWSKRASCFFCGKLVSNFSRHLKRMHSKEDEMKKILATPEGSDERKLMYEILRKKGNFKYNTKCIRNKTGSSIILKMSIPNKKPNHLPCKFCLGFYSKDRLLKHMRRCKLRDADDDLKNCQEEGEALLASSCANLEEDVTPDMDTENAREATSAEKNISTVEEPDHHGEVVGKDETGVSKTKHCGPKTSVTTKRKKRKLKKKKRSHYKPVVRSTKRRELITPESEDENQVAGTSFAKQIFVEKQEEKPLLTQTDKLPVRRSSIRVKHKRDAEPNLSENEEPPAHQVSDFNPDFVSKLLELKRIIENEVKNSSKEDEEIGTASQTRDKRSDTEIDLMKEDQEKVSEATENTTNTTDSTPTVESDCSPGNISSETQVQNVINEATPNHPEPSTSTELTESLNIDIIDAIHTLNDPGHVTNTEITESSDGISMDPTSISNFVENPNNSGLTYILDKNTTNATSTLNQLELPTNNVTEMSNKDVTNEAGTIDKVQRFNNTELTETTNKHVINDYVIEHLEQSPNAEIPNNNAINSPSNNLEHSTNSELTKPLDKNVINDPSNHLENSTKELIEKSGENIFRATSFSNEPNYTVLTDKSEKEDINQRSTSNYSENLAMVSVSETSVEEATSSSDSKVNPANILQSETSNKNILVSTLDRAENPSNETVCLPNSSGELLKPNLLKVANMGSEEYTGNSRKLMYCIFCKRLSKTQLALHFKRKHRNEPEVEEFMALPANSRERKRMISRLVNQGYFLHNMSVMSEGKGEIVPMRRRRVPVDLAEMTMCPHCGGYYRRSGLSRHVARCYKDNSAHKGGTFRTNLLLQELMLSQENVTSSDFRKSVLLKMEESLMEVVRSDFLLMKWGLHLFKTARKHVMTQFLLYSRKCAEVGSKLEEAACLLVEVRKLMPQVKGFVDLYKPKMYDVVKAAVYSERVADFRSGCFRNPTVAQHVGVILTQISKVLNRMCLEEGIEPDMKGVASFMTEMDLNWKDDVSQIAKFSEKEQKILKSTPTVIAEDVQGLYSSLKSREIKVKEKLKEGYSLDLFYELSKVTLLQVLMLNFHNPGDIQKLRLDKYCDKNSDKHLDNNSKLDILEQICIKKWSKVELLRKHNPNSCVWFSPNTVESIDLLLQLRKEKVKELEENPYLFGTSKIVLGHYSAHVILEKHSKKYKTNNLSVLSKNQKEFVSIMTKVLSLQIDESEVLASLLGFSEVIPKNSSFLANLSECVYNAKYNSEQEVHAKQNSNKDVNPDTNSRLVKSKKNNNKPHLKTSQNTKLNLNLHERNLITACFSEFMLGQSEKMPSVKVIDKFLRIHGDQLSPQNRTRKKIWSVVYYACKGKFEKQRRDEKKKEKSKVKADEEEDNTSSPSQQVPSASSTPYLCPPTTTDLKPFLTSLDPYDRTSGLKPSFASPDTTDPTSGPKPYQAGPGPLSL